MRYVSEDIAPPAPVNKNGNCDLVHKYQWDVNVAYAVCMAESGGNPNASNLNDQHNGCRGSFGLMQIACIHTERQPEYDPERNMQKAWEIYQRSNWTPWGAFTSGAYKKFM